MDLQKKTLRVSTLAVLGALLIRLLGGPFGQWLLALPGNQQVASFLIFLETGRYAAPNKNRFPAQLSPTEPSREAESVAVFSAADTALVQIRNYCGYSVDTAALLKQPLSWNLSASTPTVLILHSHATESYTKTEDYKESSQYRTLDISYNVVSIGDRWTELLEAAGIRVVHDRTLHDQPSYNNAYTSARTAIEKYKKEYPGLLLVLDIHRDAIANTDGSQLGTTLATPLGSCAQMMLVVGTDADGLSHPNWQENMALAVKLHAQLEKATPGICRPISFRSYRFNQDLLPGALLVEVGAAGNTRQEALLSAEHLASAIISLANGSK